MFSNSRTDSTWQNLSPDLVLFTQEQLQFFCSKSASDEGAFSLQFYLISWLICAEKRKVFFLVLYPFPLFTFFLAFRSDMILSGLCILQNKLIKLAKSVWWFCFLFGFFGVCMFCFLNWFSRLSSAEFTGLGRKVEKAVQSCLSCNSLRLISLLFHSALHVVNLGILGGL